MREFYKRAKLDNALGLFIKLIHNFVIFESVASNLPLLEPYLAQKTLKFYQLLSLTEEMRRA